MKKPVSKIQSISCIWILSLISIVFCINNGFSQSGDSESGSAPSNIAFPTVIPPSPTVANLMKFEEVPVDEYSGIPDITIPIFGKGLHRKLNMSIALKYHPSGVRLPQRSGWTGTGWTLSAGGSISRTVMGKPDEKHDVGILNNGYFSIDWDALDPETSAAKEQFIWEALNYSPNGVSMDTDYDLYQFNFMGHSGRFVVLRTEDGQLVPRILSNDQKLKIEIIYEDSQLSSNGEIEEITKFIIRNQDGYTFEFEEKEFTTSTVVSTSKLYNGQTVGGALNIDTANNAYDQYISAWHLTSIKTPNEIELANFEYSPIPEEFITGGTSYSTRFVESNQEIPGDFHPDPAFRTHNRGMLEPRSSSSHTITEVETQKLSRINFIRDNSYIEFEVNPGHKEYGNQFGCELKFINVFNSENEKIDEFFFDYVYSDDNDGQTVFLNKINNKKGNTILPYRFFYTDYEDLPGFDSGKKDKWGYYNGDNNLSNVHLTPTSVNTTDILTGVLERIEFPTGGFKEFEFEANAFSFEGNKFINTFDVPENYELSLPTNNWSFTQNLVDDSLNNTSRVIQVNSPTTYADLLISNVNISSGDIQYQNDIFVKLTPITVSNTYNSLYSGTQNPPYQPEHFQDNTDLTTSFYSIAEGNHAMILNQGWYVVEVYDNVQYINGDGQSGTVTFDAQLVYSNFVDNQYHINGGGLRIASIKFTDNGEVKTSVNYEYDYIPEPDPESLLPSQHPISSGSIDYDFSAQKEYQLTRYYPFATGYNGNDHVNREDHDLVAYPISFWAKRHSDIQIQMTKGNFVGYKHVTKRQRRDNGKTVSEFTSPIDYPAYPDDYTFPFLPIKDMSFMHGLLLTQKIYDEDGRILNEIKNIDESNNDNYEIVDNVVVSGKRFSYPSDDNCIWDKMYSSYEAYLNMTEDSNLFPGFNSFNLSNCYQNSPIIAHDIEYYASIARLKESEIISYFYDEDGTQHSIHQIDKYIYNNDNNQLSERTSEYYEGGISQSTTSKMYYPVGETTSSTSLTIREAMRDLNMINEVLETKSFKNSSQTSRVNNVFGAFNTDDNGINLILPKTVETAKGSDNTETRIQFHKYDNLGNPLEVSKVDGTRIIYVWGYNNSKPIAKIVNHSYDGISTSLQNAIDLARNTSNNGTETALLLELENLQNHVDLANAQVSTFTYDILVGITSMTDAKGYRMTYVYDDLNRLEYVKDHNGNILSKNKYVYKNQY